MQGHCADRRSLQQTLIVDGVSLLKWMELRAVSVLTYVLV